MHDRVHFDAIRMSIFADKIPGHPKTCKGVTGPEYTTAQCRLCWLATYDRAHQKKWGLLQPFSRGPVLTPKEYYGCIHRGTTKLSAPGCSGCSGLDGVYECRSKKTQTPYCAVDVLGKGANTARSYGYRVCAECGFREPAADLEKSVGEMLQLLEQPPGVLPPEWPTWKTAHYAMQTAFLERCSSTVVYPQKKYHGRGIVIGAGGEVYFRCAWVVANILRDLGCFLPIQFWYLGPEELDSEMVDLARSIGVECVDAKRVAASLPVPPRILAGWELKPFSVIHSKFREVLYLDADCVPVRDPSFLFDTDEYLKTGSVFWPDLPPSKTNYPAGWIPENVWQLYGLAFDESPDFESGQFIVDKARCWKELSVTMWLNEHSDFVYRHVYGDKSTYHIAWNGCGLGYGMPSKKAGWASPSILQHDFEGNVLFQHCCQGKQQLGNGLRIPTLAHGDTAIKHATSLKMKWSGFMYKPGYPITPSKYLLEAKEGSRYNVITVAPLPVELKADGTVVGGTPEARRWGWAGSRLALIGSKRVNVQVSDFLDQSTDGVWRGSLYNLVPQ